MDRISSSRAGKAWIRWVPILVVALAATVSGSPALAQPQPTPGPAIDWQTDVVHLTAGSLALAANDLVFTTEGAPVAVGSDPGGTDSWSLEAEWIEHGVEQRLYLYFGSDGEDWWVDEVRTYDGTSDSKWVAWRGPFFRTPLGQAFEGDARFDGITGGLTLTDLRLEVSPRQVEELYATPPGGGSAAERDPFEPGEPLHCSGILGLSPAEAHERLLAEGYRVSYRLLHPTEPAKTLIVPPEGTIDGAALGSHGEVIVFVNDPSLGAVPRPTWPPECPNAPAIQPLDAMDPAPFTGTVSDTDWTGAPEVTYGDPMQLQEGVTLTMTWQTTDPRMTGDVAYTGTWHAFPRAYLTLEAASIEVTNDDGRWTGSGTGLQMDGGHPAPFTALLTGEGAYEGLTAYVVLDWMASGLQGAIFPGPMPVAPVSQ